MTGALTRSDVRGLQASLRDVYDDYAACLDAGDLPRWTEFFTDDCNYQVIARENHDAGLTHATIWCDGIGMVRDRSAALLETAVFEPRWLRHFVSGLRITAVDGAEIQAEANFLIVECLLDQPPHVSMVGRYIDTLVNVDGNFRFRQRLCVFENHHVRTTLVMPI
jgi:anthranilate 1,2-dioxygenase small subunit